MSFFSSIREWVTFAANICILLITIYTFYLTFISKKIKFMSISESLSITDGDNFSVVLENKSLSPLVIEEIYLIIDNKYKVQVKKFESPLILEAYTAQKVTSHRYSYTAPSLPSLIGNNTVLEVKTSRKKLYLRLHKKVPKVTREMRNIPYNVEKITNTYNEKIVPKNAKFVLVASKGDWQKTVFIFKTGVMTGEILGYNGMPEEAVKDQGNLLRFLDSWLKPNGVKYYVNQLTNSFIEKPTGDYQSTKE
ncbi:hypothetical protein [Brevibacillus laterosporus]|uniref:hypothetical protein n=1 Tax=Brevibacillus laterosporus TaxID=1465 RepID=UPI000EAB74FF|nr:hypothetical protein [Brevibacillus laterosporus]AYK06545.1 hypothetical protein D8Z77_09270 [Brevibacillus laterosporus]